jgi:threonine dehydrogenase-like Zn-dependent dehydrogenase
LLICTVITYTAKDFKAVIDAISSGKMKPQGMITKVLKMKEVDQGFKALTEDKDNQVKILIHTGGGA